jgi:hypothetical protein
MAQMKTAAIDFVCTLNLAAVSIVADLPASPLSALI